MRVLFYRNLEAAFVPGALLDSQGPAEQPERFASLIGSMQKQPRAGEYEIAGPVERAKAETFMALPLTGRSNELLAAVLVGTPQDSVVKTSLYIRKAGIAVGAAGIFLALIFSWLVSRGVSRPLARLEKAARDLAAGNWNSKTDVRARGEAGRAARAFDEMTAEVRAKRERLLQAERVAAWRDLARNFAVELKVPLFSLQLTIENLSRARQKTPDRFDEIFLESMKTVDSEVETLKGIIARFSDFAKMRQPHMQSVNVNDLARAVVKAFEADFQSRGRPPVKPELLLDEYAPKIWADPELLYKGLENVIANSLNAMPMGGTLTLRTSQQNGMVRVEVSDTGSGLESAEQTSASGLFAAKLEGAGLGLATIQTVVSDHGGKICVASEPGRGSTFRIELPLHRAVTTAPEPNNDLQAAAAAIQQEPR